MIYSLYLILLIFSLAYIEVYYCYGNNTLQCDALFSALLCISGPRLLTVTDISTLYNMEGKILTFEASTRMNL